MSFSTSAEKFPSPAKTSPWTGTGHNTFISTKSVQLSQEIVTSGFHQVLEVSGTSATPPVTSHRRRVSSLYTEECRHSTPKSVVTYSDVGPVVRTVGGDRRGRVQPVGDGAVRVFGNVTGQLWWRAGGRGPAQMFDSGWKKVTNPSISLNTCGKDHHELSPESESST